MLTIAKMWEALLQDKDNKIRLELTSEDQSQAIKKALSAYKTRILKYDEELKAIMKNDTLYFSLSRSSNDKLVLDISLVNIESELLADVKLLKH